MPASKIDLLNSLSPKALKLLARMPVENPNPVIIVGFDGILHYGNDAFLNLSIFKDLKIGEPITGALYSAVKEAASSGVIIDKEISSTNNYFLFTINPIKDANCAFLYGRDITLRKIQEMNLRQMALIAKETYNSIVISDPDGKITWVNKSFTKLTGYELDEVVGRTPGEFLQGPDTDPSTVSKMAEALAQREPVEVEIINYNRQGDRYWVNLQIQPVFNNEGVLENFISFQRDITQVKSLQEKIIESEQKHNLAIESSNSRLTALISNLKSGVLVEDENRNIALTNEEFCRLFGIPVPPEQLLGLDCNISAQESKHMFLEPEGFIQKIDQILAKGEIVLDEDLELADGRIFERDYVPIVSQGTFLGNLWQYRDITIRKKNQVQLEQAIQTAEQANIAKSNFLANMSHEIRTPLNAVYGIIRLLSEAPHLPEQEDLHSRLLASSETLLSIINDILDFSKIEAGLLTLENSPFNLGELISRIISSYELKASGRSIELRYHIDKGITSSLIGDQVRLGQVLINLVSNAIKFTERGYVEINCKLLSKEKGSNRIYFSIRDTGIGIDISRLEKIFESYQQEALSTTRQYGGTGLGLSISKQLVELMGGKLEVISAKGQGSTFYFTLELPVGAEALEIEKHRISSVDPEILKGTRVLVVEDNDMNQFVAKSILQKWNLEVFLAKNGKKAVEFLSENKCDIVLMDKQMPVMDGVEATRIIRQYLKMDIPIIALTADAVIEMVQECLDAGMNDYVTKPFEPAILFNKIAKVLGKQ